MVPVPEELVEEVKTYMTWKLAAPKVVESPEALRTVFDEADPELREFIRYVARITADEGNPTLVDTAEACGMNPREVIGSIGDLHTRLQAAGRGAILILPRLDPRERPDHISEWQHRVLHMGKADADLIATF